MLFSSPPSRPAVVAAAASRPPRKVPSAFTLLELLTVVFILAILGVMALPVFKQLQKRAGIAGCATNLKNLYVGANGYVTEHNRWPQIKAPSADRGHDDAYVTAWMNALAPYGITPSIWVCPELHRLRGRPDLTVLANRQMDYLATTFDTKPRRPYEHSNTPWFVETTNTHGGGHLMIFANGSVMGMREAVATFTDNAKGSKK